MDLGALADLCAELKSLEPQYKDATTPDWVPALREGVQRFMESFDGPCGRAIIKQLLADHGPDAAWHKVKGLTLPGHLEKLQHLLGCHSILKNIPAVDELPTEVKEPPLLIPHMKAFVTIRSTDMESFQDLFPDLIDRADKYQKALSGLFIDCMDKHDKAATKIAKRLDKYRLPLRVGILLICKLCFANVFNVTFPCLHQYGSH